MDTVRVFGNNLKKYRMAILYVFNRRYFFALSSFHAVPIVPKTATVILSEEEKCLCVLLNRLNSPSPL